MLDRRSEEIYHFRSFSADEKTVSQPSMLRDTTRLTEALNLPEAEFSSASMQPGRVRLFCVATCLAVL